MKSFGVPSNILTPGLLNKTPKHAGRHASFSFQHTAVHSRPSQDQGSVLSVDEVSNL